MTGMREMRKGWQLMSEFGPGKRRREHCESDGRIPARKKYVVARVTSVYGNWLHHSCCVVHCMRVFFDASGEMYCVYAKFKPFLNVKFAKSSHTSCSP